MVVTGLVLGQTLMVVPTKCYSLMSRVSSQWFVVCLHIKKIVYKNLNPWVHIGTSESTCL